MMKKYIFIGLFFLTLNFAKAQISLPAFQGALNVKSNVIPISNALDFDGVNDYVSVGADAKLNITSTIKLSAWIYRNTIGRDDCIIGKDQYGTNAKPQYHFVLGKIMNI